ncbi:ABC transporter substrate-binding protein [Laceyella putida]|uniref:Probable sugar-binding periplasmic protein n=1 Tax=Laceyella putida TaxID=110101 RepID=A0ABW2RP14_9BACL
MRKEWSTLALLFALMLVLTACSQSSAISEPSDPKQANQLEIFSWWTGAGEEAGLQALLKVFTEKHPDIAVVNAAAAGGAGTNFKTVLATRIQKNKPPDTFQVHGGAELNEQWVAAGKMEPLNDLFTQQGWMDKFPASLVQMVSKDGKIYSIPVNVHRSNVLWYNKKVFDQYGLKPPATFDDFFKAADTLKAKGITPLALGDKEPWAATHLFESVLAGTLGPIDYNKLWSGHVHFDDPRIKLAFDTYKKMLTYVNQDHANHNWQDSVQMVGKGEAAMTVMGDWAKGYLSNDLELKLNQDFGFAPAPNTKGIFIAVTDTFGLPKGAKHPLATKKFLEVIGSAEAQDAFNPIKGSIPARLDADVNKYDEYGKTTIEDFKKDFITPSLAHGSAAPQGFVAQCNQLIHTFVAQGDVPSALTALKQAATANHIGSKK